MSSAVRSITAGAKISRSADGKIARAADDAERAAS